MARTVNDRVRLLHGPYRTPRLRRGGRAFCLFRDCDVVVTGWADARLRPRIAYSGSSSLSSADNDSLGGCRSRPRNRSRQPAKKR